MWVRREGKKRKSSSRGRRDHKFLVEKARLIESRDGEGLGFLRKDRLSDKVSSKIRKYESEKEMATHSSTLA